jgi:hypothetical protein
LPSVAQRLSGHWSCTDLAENVGQKIVARRRVAVRDELPIRAVTSTHLENELAPEMA